MLSPIIPQNQPINQSYPLNRNNFFSNLNQDIITCILYDWLSPKDIGQLDIACINHNQRQIYYEALQGSKKPLIQFISYQCDCISDIFQMIAWGKSRNILSHLIKELNIDIPENQKKKCIKYLFCLESLISLTELSINIIDESFPITISQLSNLTNLKLSNVSIPINLFSSINASFQQLKDIRLSQCYFNSNFLMNLQSLPSLLTLTIIKNKNPLNQKDFQFLSNLTNLQSLTLFNNISTNYSDFHLLSNLIHLSSLSLRFCDINNKGFRGICQLTQLKLLELGSCGNINFIEETFDEFIQFKQLIILDLQHTSIDNRFMRNILQLTQLTDLILNKNHLLTPDVFYNLSQLIHLQNLELHDIQIDERILLEIIKLSQLSHFALSILEENVSLSFLELLSQIQSLKSLYIAYKEDKFTDEYLLAISKIKSLVTLEIAYDNQVTLQGIKSLSQLIHLQRLIIKKYNNLTFDDCYQEVYKEAISVILGMSQSNLTINFIYDYEDEEE